MAKQPEDLVTQELPLPDAPRKRGRPSTGNALTPAERKAAQRRRAPKIVHERVEDAPVTSILSELAYAVKRGNVLTARSLMDELYRRTELNRLNR